MALILCIETATEVCSAALFRDAEILGIKESSVQNAHSAVLTTFISEIFQTSGFSPGDVDAVAVSTGPGSYTGLRIGVAVAKGLCYALDKPLIAIPTLQAMAEGMTPPLLPSPKWGGVGGGVLFCPMIDARRMEVYCALYDNDIKEIREVRAEIIDEFSFQEFLADHPVVFGGEGADKCKPFLEANPNALFLDSFRASAKFMIGLAEEKFGQQRFENLAYFEPFYLKDFVAGKPRVKGLI
ncbi:MAG: tRNA (adenosine(37)-N6)-threonylcarbamoyltransferase complex dimerization subunit type 1 TsaB [bacterium]